MNNVDYSVFLKVAKRPWLRWALTQAGFISPSRAALLDKFDRDIILHDLSKGIPYPDGSFDVIYHSHFLEHLPKDVAASFTRQCVAKLKPGGVLRIVVPDLEVFVRDYLSSLEAAVDKPKAMDQYDASVWALLQQLVALETGGTGAQNRVRRAVENLVLGDRRRRGDLHQWMYDRVSLPPFLSTAGLERVELCTYRESRIPGWDDLLLDRNADGTPYKLRSVYVEGQKPL